MLDINEYHVFAADLHTTVMGSWLQEKENLFHTRADGAR